MVGAMKNAMSVWRKMVSGSLYPTYDMIEEKES
jgi:hypothetical protein